MSNPSNQPVQPPQRPQAPAQGQQARPPQAAQQPQRPAQRPAAQGQQPQRPQGAPAQQAQRPAEQQPVAQRPPQQAQRPQYAPNAPAAQQPAARPPQAPQPQQAPQARQRIQQPAAGATVIGDRNVPEGNIPEGVKEALVQEAKEAAILGTRPAPNEKPAWYKKIESQIMLWAELGVSDVQMVSDGYVWIVDDDNHQPTSMWLTKDDIYLLADYWEPGNEALEIQSGAKVLAEGARGTLEVVQTLGQSFTSESTQSWRARIIFRRQETGLGVTMRLIPPTVPTIDKYPQPQQILDLLKENNGLFLVCGPTGSGKTTLLAALLDYYNENNHRHIYTIEEPIEFVHIAKKSLITQREVGRDVDSWAGGIMAAVRSKAQVILIGELRELEAIEAALDAANKGHMVFATTHASSAAQTIEVLVSQFPGDKQNLIQNRIAEVLKCVMVQRLVPGIDGKLIPVREIMVDHTTTTPRIRSGHFTELTGALKEEDNMISFEMSLFYLYEAGKITEETALKFANVKDDLIYRIERLKARRREEEEGRNNR